MFETVKAYTIWMLNNLPTFLMAEPICYFIGIAILLWIIKIIFNLSNRSF